jgi:hypothetical protein
MNALKTGIYAESLILPHENVAALEQLIDEYYHRHHPTTPEARALIDDLIYGEWLKRRLRAAETQLWAYDHKHEFRPDDQYPLGQTAASRGKAFAQLQSRTECIRRTSERALQNLKQLQAEAETTPPAPDPQLPPAAVTSLPPTPQTTFPPIGFVPETASNTPSRPAAEPDSNPDPNDDSSDDPSDCAALPHLLK